MEADLLGPYFRPEAHPPNQYHGKWKPTWQNKKTPKDRKAQFLAIAEKHQVKAGNATNLRCAVCFGINGRACKGCHAIAYCCREHQIQHWAIHQFVCRPLVTVDKEEVFRNLSSAVQERNPDQNVGMYIAAKPLNPKDTVLHLQPIMHAAHNKGLPIPPDSILCLGCNRWYQDSQGYRCKKCKWPVCCQKCEVDTCHAKYECKVFAANKVYPPLNPSYFNGDAILVLRCLMLKETKPADWEMLTALEPVVEHLVRPKHLLEADEKVSKYLIYNCRLQDSMGVTREEIMNLLKVIDYCSVWLPERSAYLWDRQIAFVSAKYVFPMKILIAEDCAPNCNWSLHQSPKLEECSLRLRAVVPIYPGQYLTASFSEISSFGATFPSRYENSRFTVQCKCRRCTDPTEGGSFFSGIKCPTCVTDETQQDNRDSCYLLPEDPSDYKCTWRCHNSACSTTASGVDVAKDIIRIHKEILSNSNSLQGLINVLKTNDGIKLHPNHYLIMKAVQLCIDLCYGVCKNTSLIHISTGLLEKAKALASKLLKIYKFVYPSYSRENAKLLFHIQMLHGIAKVRELYWIFHQEKAPEEDEHYFPNEFWDILKVQKVAVEVLMQEPPGSIERENAIQMQEVLEDTEALLITERRNGRIQLGTVISLHKVYSRYCSGYLYSVLPIFEDKDFNELVLFKGPFCKDLVDISKFMTS